MLSHNIECEYHVFEQKKIFWLPYFRASKIRNSGKIRKTHIPAPRTDRTDRNMTLMLPMNRV